MSTSESLTSDPINEFKATSPSLDPPSDNVFNHNVSDEGQPVLFTAFNTTFTPVSLTVLIAFVVLFLACLLLSIWYAQRIWRENGTKGSKRKQRNDNEQEANANGQDIEDDYWIQNEEEDFNQHHYYPREVPTKIFSGDSSSCCGSSPRYSSASPAPPALSSVLKSQRYSASPLKASPHYRYMCAGAFGMEDDTTQNDTSVSFGDGSSYYTADATYFEDGSYLACNDNVTKDLSSVNGDSCSSSIDLDFSTTWAKIQYPKQDHSSRKRSVIAMAGIMEN